MAHVSPIKMHHVDPFFTRNGHNWSGRFPAIAESVRKLPAQELWLDGELVVLKEDGRSCFVSLQRVARLDQKALVFMPFDVMHFDGRDVCQKPLEIRKMVLNEIIGPGAWNLRYLDRICGDGVAFFGAAAGGDYQ